MGVRRRLLPLSARRGLLRITLSLGCGSKSNGHGSRQDHPEVQTVSHLFFSLLFLLREFSE
jgi:hypothetical protein